MPQQSSIKKLLEKSQKIPLKTLRHISSADTASLLFELDSEKSEKLFQLLLESKLAVSVLSEMRGVKLRGFLKSLPQKTLVKLFSEGSMDDLVYLIDFTPRPNKLLEQLPLEKKITLQKFMDYPEDSAGRIMQDDYFSLSFESSVGQGIDKLREYSREKFVHYIYAVDKEKTLIGVLSIRELAISAPEVKIKDIINKQFVSVQPWESAHFAATIVSKHNFIAIPVVDKKNKIAGLITVDDVLDLVEESATAKIYAMAGLSEGDRIYTKISKTIKNRLPWLAVNLVFAILASSIISLFEQTMSRLIILATLKNIVAGIGGNTAIQTLTVTARGLDTGDFNFTTVSKAFIKETFSGLTTGCALGIGAGIITYFWKSSFLVSGIIFVAMVLNSLVAVWAGFMTPILMQKMKKDPAISSGVIVTVITDIFGFFIFLSLAALGLSLFGESL